MGYHAFICYPSEDYELAYRVNKILKKQFDVFFDKDSLKPGDKWSVKIPFSQNNSLSTIIFVSEYTINSDYACDEIKRAINLKKYSKHLILPIIIPKEDGTFPTIPFGLGNLECIKYTNNMGGLIKNIKTSLVEHLDAQKLLDIGIEKEIEIDNDRFTESNENSLNVEETEHQITNYFYNRITQYRYKSYFFWAFLDIDKFTQINNAYGNKCGNYVLNETKKIIKNLTNDIFFKRFYSDEYGILIPNCDLERGIELMENLQKYIVINDWSSVATSLHVTSSIGINCTKLNRPYSKKDVKYSLIGAAEGCKASKNENEYDPLESENMHVKEYQSESDKRELLRIKEKRRRELEKKRIRMAPKVLSRKQKTSTYRSYCS